VTERRCGNCKHFVPSQGPGQFSECHREPIKTTPMMITVEGTTVLVLPNGKQFLPTVSEIDGVRMVQIPNGVMPKLHLDVRYAVTQPNIPACGEWGPRLAIAHSLSDEAIQAIGSPSQNNGGRN
jgi:hypothetical protein